MTANDSPDDPYQIIPTAGPQTIDELASHVPLYSDDFILPPLIPTVEDALILPRQTDVEAPKITPPDALHFMNPPSSK